MLSAFHRARVDEHVNESFLESQAGERGYSHEDETSEIRKTSEKLNERFGVE